LETEGSLPRSQESATGPYPEPGASNTQLKGKRKDVPVIN